MYVGCGRQPKRCVGDAFLHSSFGSETFVADLGTNESDKTPKQASKPSEYVRIGQIKLSFEATETLRLDVLIQNVRASVGAKLGVSAHRIKLLNEGQAGLFGLGKGPQKRYVWF